MAEKSFPLENTMYKAGDAQLWFATRTSGVYAGDDLGVTANGTMDLTLGPGIAWLAYDRFKGCVYANTENLTKTAEMSDGMYDRIDRFCVRVEKITQRCYAYIKKGAPASAPVPPELQDDNVAYELSAAQIRVRVGATGINAGDITDERLDPDVCGLMSDGVTGIDTSVIQAQVSALIRTLHENLQAVYDGVERVNLDYIPGTLFASDWSGSGPYTQTVAAEGVLASDKPTIDVDMTAAITLDEMETLNEAWSGNILKATPAANSVVVFFKDVPDVDIPVKIEVVR